MGDYPSAQSVMPRWKITALITDAVLTLRKNDYVLFVHMIFNNILSDTRNLDEFLKRKDDKRGQIDNHSDSSVCYGYDIKDNTPTTYLFQISVPNIVVNFTHQNESDKVGAISSDDFSWSYTKTYKKSEGFVTKQDLTCGSIVLRQTSGNKSFSGHENLLLPLKYTSSSEENENSLPNIHYTSTSKPADDSNVKLLHITNACIYYIHPAWLRIKFFFSSLPSATIYSPAYAATILQLADGFFEIDSKSNSNVPRFETETGTRTGTRTENENDPQQFTPFQFRLILSGARAICVADSSSTNSEEDESVTLKVDLDFLHTKLVGGGSTDQFFVNGMEIFTGCANSPDLNAGSLLHPLSIRGVLAKESHTLAERTTIEFEKVRARASYSDMILALDVGLKLKSEILEQAEILMNETEVKEYRETPKMSMSKKTKTQFKTPTAKQLNVFGDGISFKIVDDSGRHFSGSQELLELSLEKYHFSVNRKITKNTEMLKKSASELSTTKLRLEKLVLIDCLQHVNSPFRFAACSYYDDEIGGGGGGGEEKESEPAEEKEYSVSDNNSIIDARWGWESPPVGVIHIPDGDGDGLSLLPSRAEILLELVEKGDEEKNVNLQTSAFSFQWNPATVVALQRFVGRLSKEVKFKFSSSLPSLPSLPSLQTPTPSPSPTPTPISTLEPPTSTPALLKATITIEFLRISLNKEHQGRKLLTLNFANLNLSYLHDTISNEKDVTGSIDTIQATDPSLKNKNRDVVFDNSGETKKFIQFCFRKFDLSSNTFTTTKTAKSKIKQKKDMDYVNAKCNHNFTQSCDDFLLVEVAGLTVNYLHGRTLELVDYLSNGLPGRGMAASSKHAKGFLERRVQTKSVLCVKIAAGKVIIPKNKHVDENSDDDDVIACKTGRTELISYFDTKKGEEGAAGWWRHLTVHVVGVGGGSVIRKPLDFRLDLETKLATEKNSVKTVSITSSISEAFFLFRLSDYRLLRETIMQNFGEVNKMSQENVEREADLGNLANSTMICYADGARMINYKFNGGERQKQKQQEGVEEEEEEEDVGQLQQQQQQQPQQQKIINFALKLNNIELTISKNDPTQTIASISVNNTRASLTRINNSKTSVDLLISRIAMVDLVDRGNSFSKLVGMYSNDEDLDQLTLRMSKENNDSSSVVIVVLSKMSFNAMAVPWTDISSFFVVGDDDDDGEEREKKEKMSTSTSTTGTHYGLSVKLVADNPRIFLLADEKNVNSKALVLTGLAIVNASFTNGGEERTTKKCCTVQCHSVESYVNMDVDTLLGSGSASASADHEANLNLGVALIEPISAEIEYSSSTRSLHATHRSLNLTFDSVAVLLSHSDLKMVQMVFTKWQNEKLETGRRNSLENANLQEQFRRKEEEGRQRVVDQDHELLVQQQQFLSLTATQSFVGGGGGDGFYEVQFTTSKLGLLLRKSHRSVLVEKVKVNHLLGVIEVGDTLIAINNNPIRRIPFRNVVQSLVELPRPLLLTFSSGNGNGKGNGNNDINSGNTQHSNNLASRTGTGTKNLPSKNENQSIFMVKFSCGSMGTGIKVVPSPCGNVALVESVTSALFNHSSGGGGDGSATKKRASSAIEVIYENEEAVKHAHSILPSVHQRVPRPGTVIIAINDILAVDLGFEEVSKITRTGQFYNSTIMSPVATTTSTSTSSAQHDNKYSSFSITFREADAELWGYVDKFQINVPRIQLTLFEDTTADYNPSDNKNHNNNSRASLHLPRNLAPLVNLTMHNIFLGMQRSLGRKTKYIKTRVPSILTILDIDLKESKNKFDQKEEQRSILERKCGKEIVTSVNFSVDCRLDVWKGGGGGGGGGGGWEPFVENLSLNVGVETQPGDDELKPPRAMEMAVAVSDVNVGNNNSERKGMGMIVANFSDQAAEVLFRTKKIWGGENEEDARGEDSNNNNIVSVALKLAEKSAKGEGKQTQEKIEKVFTTSGITVQNYLPCSISYVVTDSSFAAAGVTTLGTGVIQIGEMAFVECDTSKCNPHGKFKAFGMDNWSEFVCLLPAELSGEGGRRDDEGEEGEWEEVVEEEEEEFVGVGRVNKKRGGKNENGNGSSGGRVGLKTTCFQAFDSNNIPMTFGLRFSHPKHNNNNNSNKITISHAEIYCDLWLKNTSGVDLVVGSPLSRLSSLDQALTSSAKAEQALQEIAAILEIGDSGRRMDDQDDANRNIVPLPNQRAREVVEEIYEYVELDQQRNVIRRWFATESFNHSRKVLSSVVVGDPRNYKWKESDWTCWGWESTRSVHAGFAKGVFSDTQPIRRRRWMRTMVRKEEVDDNNIDNDNDNNNNNNNNSFICHHPYSKAATTAATTPMSVLDKLNSATAPLSSMLAYKAGNGKWSKTFKIGASRPATDRVLVPNGDNGMYDLVYAVKPLGHQGKWVLSKTVEVTSRITIINDSEKVEFRVSQWGVGGGGAA